MCKELFIHETKSGMVLSSSGECTDDCQCEMPYYPRIVTRKSISSIEDGVATFRFRDYDEGYWNRESYDYLVVSDPEGLLDPDEPLLCQEGECMEYVHGYGLCKKHLIESLLEDIKDLIIPPSKDDGFVDWYEEECKFTHFMDQIMSFDSKDITLRLKQKIFLLLRNSGVVEEIEKCFLEHVSYQDMKEWFDTTVKCSNCSKQYFEKGEECCKAYVPFKAKKSYFDICQGSYFNEKKKGE